MGGNETSLADQLIKGKIELIGLSFLQLILAASVTLTLIVLSVYLIQYRVRKTRKKTNNIPRKIMPFLRPGDLPTKQRNLIINELARSNDTQMYPPHDITNHMGYGQEEEQKLIHFKNTIAASVYVLEKAVSHLNPSVRERPVLTVRELFLQENNPKLDRELCKYYIETYERARFSKDEFGLEDYQQFVEKFQLIVEAFVLESKKMGKTPILSTEEEEMESNAVESERDFGTLPSNEVEMKLLSSSRSSKRVNLRFED
eukprot:TRINITY_DN1000_c1_g1_i1.p1 TRINITY_DN1000_c1_g1~~TRINITY_DN1000_c1_g1_i1.p1  ORF type:complete len:258 (-),score=96.88 TRINITY_DN1000_c1_g1_i1:825-1598(-)